ncbi:hypothetical protein MKQ70_11870 [Chitinophaga sedimenti]|uniref:hypothetical protein n=1 Tax=Chitinophaga sedimenti TaxID=2033606 RepID=UPI002005894C|nr:hypothetical protein [Chitinophaga sedimenti]MCK7555674.1 hypothetical protein [Chitinophaga sedimenti]
MNLSEVYRLLGSRIFYNLANASRVRFSEASIFVDRRSGVPFSLREQEGQVYLETALYSDEHTLLRVQTDHPDGSPLHLYQKETNEEVLVLD